MKLSDNSVIEKFRKTHGDKYDYSKVEYKNNNTKVVIICPIHGEFKQRPKDHINGQGCPKCGEERRAKLRTDTLECFVRKYFEKFPENKEKYDFSESVYVNNHTQMKVKCSEHGYFNIQPLNLMKGGNCSKCVKLYRMSKEEFIEKARNIHGKNRYDYSEVIFKNVRKRITIKCNECGKVFKQLPYAHLQGQGCRQCFEKHIGQMLVSNTEEFIRKAKNIHGNRYDYSNVNYVNNRVKVDIICKKHGLFKQTPHNHIAGQGCPKCNESKLERTIERILQENDINFEQQYTKINGNMKMDFYLNDLNMVIECQGIQHFEPTAFNTINKNKAEELFEKNLKRDLKKYNKCIEKNVEILYYTDINVDGYDIFNNPLYNGIYKKRNFFQCVDGMLVYIKNKTI